MLSPAVLTLLVVASTARAAATPLLLSNPMTTRQMAPDVVASVDRYAAAACTGTICNVAGSGDLLVGCNVIRDGCRASLVLNYANNGCKGMYICNESLPFSSCPLYVKVAFLLLIYSFFFGGGGLFDCFSWTQRC